MSKTNATSLQLSSQLTSQLVAQSPAAPRGAAQNKPAPRGAARNKPAPQAIATLTAFATTLASTLATVIATLLIVQTVQAQTATSDKTNAKKITITKAVAIAKLRAWRERVIEHDLKTENSQKSLITELSRAQLKTMVSADKKLEDALDDIQTLDSERMEHDSHRRIVDQLIFIIDSKWNGTDLNGFLIAQLLELAVVDLASPGQGRWWRFLIQASIALREVAEPNADPILFLESYSNESRILSPKPLGDMLKTMRYVGG